MHSAFSPLEGASVLHTRPLNDRLSSLSLDRFKSCRWVGGDVLTSSAHDFTPNPIPPREMAGAQLQKSTGQRGKARIILAWPCVLEFNQTTYHQGKVKWSVGSSIVIHLLIDVINKKKSSHAAVLFFSLPWDKPEQRFNRCRRLQETWELSWAFPSLNVEKICYHSCSACLKV